MLKQPERSTLGNGRSFQAAVRAVALAREYTSALYVAARQKKWNTKAETQLHQLVLPGIYEGWKSTEKYAKFYLVYGVIPDTEGKNDPLVRYQALYKSVQRRPIGRSLINPNDGFLEPVDRPHGPPFPYVGIRFRLHGKPLDVERVRELAKLIPRLRRYASRERFLKELKRCGF